jgi:hypothetical protein
LKNGQIHHWRIVICCPNVFMVKLAEALKFHFLWHLPILAFWSIGQLSFVYPSYSAICKNPLVKPIFTANNALAANKAIKNQCFFGDS